MKSIAVLHFIVNNALLTKGKKRGKNPTAIDRSI